MTFESVLLGLYRRTRKRLDARRLLRVRKLCFFVGSGRSGTSLMGALLNAHPEITMGHEYCLFERLRDGESARQRRAILLDMFQHIRRQNRYGLVNSSYEYLIPNGHQKTIGYPRVIGDKKGVPPAIFFRDQGPETLERMPYYDWPMCFIHMVRNPYSVITVMYRKAMPGHSLFKRNLDWRKPLGRDDALGELIERAKRECTEGRRLLFLICEYFARIEGVMRLQAYGSPPLMHVHYSQLMRAPRTEIKRVLRHLDIPCDESHLVACESVIQPMLASSHKDCAEIWSDEMHAIVDSQMRRFGLFKGYGWDSELVLD